MAITREQYRALIALLQPQDANIKAVLLGGRAAQATSTATDRRIAKFAKADAADDADAIAAALAEGAEGLAELAGLAPGLRSAATAANALAQVIEDNVVPLAGGGA